MDRTAKIIITILCALLVLTTAWAWRAQARAERAEELDHEHMWRILDAMSVCSSAIAKCAPAAPSAAPR
jgi:hypothetical protein